MAAEESVTARARLRSKRQGTSQQHRSTHRHELWGEVLLQEFLDGNISVPPCASVYLAKGANPDAWTHLQLLCWNLPLIKLLLGHGNAHMGKAVTAVGSEIRNLRNRCQGQGWPNLCKPDESAHLVQGMVFSVSGITHE